MLNTIIIVVLINCIIITNTSASVTTDGKSVTENSTQSSDILKSVKLTTEGPLLPSNKSNMKTDSPISDDIEKQLKDIFVVNFTPKSMVTSGPQISDEFSSDEVKINSIGKTLSLGRRTNFRAKPNCRCIIHNRCAKTESCLTESRK